MNFVNAGVDRFAEGEPLMEKVGERENRPMYVTFSSNTWKIVWFRISDGKKA